MLSRDKVASLLREQADVCRTFGSALYGDLLARASDNALVGGVAFELPRCNEARNPRADALALRLMAAVHVWLLSLPFPARPTKSAAPRRCLCACWRWARVLVLRWDPYRYGAGDLKWGPAASPVDLVGLWTEPPRVIPSAIDVVERRGCDPRPIDPAAPEGRLSLLASLWADQVARVGRLRGALDIATRVPAEVEGASVRDWLPRNLQRKTPGLATVLYHSIVQEYFDDLTATLFHNCLALAGAARVLAP